MLMLMFVGDVKKKIRGSQSMKRLFLIFMMDVVSPSFTFTLKFGFSRDLFLSNSRELFLIHELLIALLCSLP
jgi:hypothetical protein